MGINLRMALRALTLNRLQAVLTLLGMGVGVAMVVIVSGLGRGAQLKIESQIEAAGPTRITIRSGNFTPAALDNRGEQDSGGGEPSEGAVSAAAGQGGEMSDISTDSAAMDARKRMRAVKATRYRTPATPLGHAEMDMLKTRIADVRSVAGNLEGNRTVDAGATVTARVVRVQGFDEAWPEMAGWRLEEGRLLKAAEHGGSTPVMVLTAQAAQRLWPGETKFLDKTVPLGGQAVRVVGIIEDSQEEAGVVPVLHVPVALAQSLLGRSNYDSIAVRTTSVGVTSAVAKDVRTQLRLLHKLPDDTVDDFRAETQSVSAMPGMGSDPRLARAVHANAGNFEQASWEQMAKSLRQASRTFTLLLAGGAAVSLLVGGIGVMNIMLVSVTARTREIGLRMALGARANDVMIQFLVEAVTLAALGGVIGLMLGGVGLFITEYQLHWSTAASPAMLVAALAMAALTGIVFGIGPARRAALLDPVVALKSE